MNSKACPSFAKSVPIWFSTIGGLLVGVGVELGVGLGTNEVNDVTAVLVVKIEVLVRGGVMKVDVGSGGIVMQINSPLSFPMQISSILHGFEEHGSRFIPHNGPVKLLGQLQVNSPNNSFTQVALFKHGSISHSSMSVEQFLPVKPVLQLHVYVEFPSRQVIVPLTSHGMLEQ